MQAICTAGGSLSPFKCQPRTLIASPTSKTFTFGCLLPKATTDAGGSPRTYSSGMVSVMAFAMVRAARTMERHESRYPLYFLVSSECWERKEDVLGSHMLHYGPSSCDEGAGSSWGKVSMSTESAGLRIVVPGSRKTWASIYTTCKIIKIGAAAQRRDMPTWPSRVNVVLEAAKFCCMVHDHRSALFRKNMRIESQGGLLALITFGANPYCVINRLMRGSTEKRAR